METWKRDPFGTVHTVERFEFGVAKMHCGVELEVDTAKSEPPAKWDQGCAECRKVRHER